MADPHQLERDASSFAKSAIEHDQRGEFNTAIFFYSEAACALLNAVSAGSQTPGAQKRAEEYIARAETLKKSANNDVKSMQKTGDQRNLTRAEFLVRSAMNEDSEGHDKEALDLYMQAADLCLQLKKDSVGEVLAEKLGKLAFQSIERAEELKGLSPSRSRGRDTASMSRTARSRSPRVAGPAQYTEQEIAVLRTTSHINGREYVPFLEVDLKERFAYPVPFSDPVGLLSLSRKQIESLDTWMRPDEFISDPTLIYAVSAYSIRQTVVSDCSFVASLAISAQYERRFKQKLITSIIYPQNKRGEPEYNPCGKYMVKLHINGVSRKVIIDDRLPMGRHGQLLCSFSSNKSELWVSLLEKAYMKVTGGYDFPGSNSSIDLNALTGWIPERVAIKTKDNSFNKEHEFDRILDRFHKGHCLVTVATGPMDEATADRAGLVESHAYALLDIRNVDGQRLLLLKNPWCHVRWKGNWSELDKNHWTSEMQKRLNYDPTSAQTFDNGIFWIDYDSLCHFFDVFYLSWNPSIFNFTTCVHGTWLAAEGPRKDTYSIADNPQYTLEVRATKPAAVWVLLSRHITDKEDFANNKEFITIVVYRTGGKRVFYPFDPEPYKDGIRINSPHYLCKMILDPVQGGCDRYTLVVSQYDKSTTIHYTLRVYSTQPSSLVKITPPYNSRHDKQVTSEWTEQTAGGCSNYRDTWQNNPIYQIHIDKSTGPACLLLQLKAPKQFSVGLEVVCVSAHGVHPFTSKASGDYRRGFCYMELDHIPPGVYNVRLSTFLPKQCGPFVFSIQSSVAYNTKRIQ